MKSPTSAPFGNLDEKWSAIRKWRLLLVAIGVSGVSLANVLGVYSEPVWLSGCLSGALAVVAYCLALRDAKEISLIFSFGGILFLITATDYFLKNAPLWVWFINGWSGLIATLGAGAFLPLHRGSRRE
jgi:hypothetical protein